MPMSIALSRLHNQYLLNSPLQRPADVVRALVAVQAQDFALSKWGLGLRFHGATDALVEQAFTDGAILRTHVLRPTWHFVAPADIHWLLALTAPRVHALNRPYYRKLELDDTMLQRLHGILIEALQGGNFLTRDELRNVLAAQAIHTTDQLRMSYILMHAELEGVICSGPRRGKQFTYALLQERVPQVRTLEREEAVMELARRYFQSRGPATVHDFAKWSGLTVAEARGGLAGVKAQFQEEVIDGQTYWFAPSGILNGGQDTPTYLLSIYDEYISGYKDRSAIVDAENAARLVTLGNDLTAVVVVNGRIIGTWKRMIKQDEAIVTTHLFQPQPESEQHALAQAVIQYGTFLGLGARLD
jgi:hypothetical protein